jgi:hypothetical protein
MTLWTISRIAASWLSLEYTAELLEGQVINVANDIIIIYSFLLSSSRKCPNPCVRLMKNVRIVETHIQTIAISCCL